MSTAPQRVFPAGPAGLITAWVFDEHHNWHAAESTSAQPLVVGTCTAMLRYKTVDGQFLIDPRPPWINGHEAFRSSPDLIKVFEALHVLYPDDNVVPGMPPEHFDLFRAIYPELAAHQKTPHVHFNEIIDLTPL